MINLVARFNATDVTIIATANTFDNAGKVGVSTVDLEVGTF